MLQPTLTVDEAAHYLKRRPKTVRGWIAAGKLRARKIGRGYVIPEEEVRKLIDLEEREVAPRDEVKAYDPARHGRIEELRRMCAGLKPGDALEFQRAQQIAMSGGKAAPQ